MLKVHSQGLFRSGYRVSQGGHDRATIRPHRLRSGSEVVLDGAVYDLSRTGLIAGDYVFSSRGHELARGSKAFASRTMTASFANQSVELRPRSFRSKYQVIQHGRVVGSIGPRPVINSYPADLPDTIPIVYQVFLIALVVVRWRQDADAS